MARSKKNEVSNYDVFMSVLKMTFIILVMSLTILAGARVIGKIDTYNDNSKNTVIEIQRENPYIQKNP